MPDNSTNDTAPGSDRQGIQVISRAAALLRALEHSPEGLSLGELARAIGLPRSTVQRIVDALHGEGLVVAASSNNGVRLGPALLSLAAATRFHIGQMARDTLEALAKASEETVDLSIPTQDRMVFIDQVSGRHRLAAVSAVGVSFPMHSSANGKAVLAAMTDADIDRLKRRMVLTPETSHTITHWPRLQAEIEAVRRSGIAYDREENSLGISAIAMAIRSPSGEIAAVSIPVPTQRFQDIERKLSELLRGHVQALQQQLSR